MAGESRADTRQMRITSEVIEAACRGLNDNTGQIVELLERLANILNEAETTQALRRLGTGLQESDTAIHQSMLEVGKYLGETATVIETVLAEGQADLDATTRQISSGGGRYGSALNG